MEGQCIICLERKPSSDFNREHVFPETINGQLCISSVCKACNGHLGRTIDEPFLEHIAIASLRHKYGLVRENRGIKSSLKHYSRSDEDFYYEFRDGVITKHLKPKGGKKSKEDGQSFVEYSLDEVDCSDERIESYTKKAASILGVNPEDLTQKIEKSYHPPEEKIFLAPNLPLTMEAVKIAYELVTEHVPHYLDSAIAKDYAVALKTGELKEPLINLANSALPVINISMSKGNWMKIFGNHFAMIGSIQGIGLVAAVNFFGSDMTYPFCQVIILSLGDEFMDVAPIFIINSFKEKKVERIEKGITLTGKIRLPRSFGF